MLPTDMQFCFQSQLRQARLLHAKELCKHSYFSVLLSMLMLLLEGYTVTLFVQNNTIYRCLLEILVTSFIKIIHRAIVLETIDLFV